jgi:hypothetical protein
LLASLFRLLFPKKKERSSEKGKKKEKEIRSEGLSHRASYDEKVSPFPSMREGVRLNQGIGVIVIEICVIIF